MSSTAKDNRPIEVVRTECQQPEWGTKLWRSNIDGVWFIICVPQVCEGEEVFWMTAMNFGEVIPRDGLQFTISVQDVSMPRCTWTVERHQSESECEVDGPIHSLRAVQRLCEDAVAEALLGSFVIAGDTLNLDSDANGDVILKNSRGQTKVHVYRSLSIGPCLQVHAYSYMSIGPCLRHSRV